VCLLGGVFPFRLISGIRDIPWPQYSLDLTVPEFFQCRIFIPKYITLSPTNPKSLKVRNLGRIKKKIWCFIAANFPEILTENMTIY
jgi:hypothetical protein